MSRPGIKSSRPHARTSNSSWLLGARGTSTSFSVCCPKRGILKLVSKDVSVLTPASKQSSTNDPAVRDEKARAISQEPRDGSSNNPAGVRTGVCVGAVGVQGYAVSAVSATFLSHESPVAVRSAHGLSAEPVGGINGPRIGGWDSQERRRPPAITLCVERAYSEQILLKVLETSICRCTDASAQ